MTSQEEAIKAGHKAQEFVNNLENDADYFAAIFCLAHHRFGSHWGFDNDNEDKDIEKLLEVYEEQKDTNPIMARYLKMYRLQSKSDTPAVLVEVKDWLRPGRIILSAFDGNKNYYNLDELNKIYLRDKTTNLIALKDFLESGKEGTLAIYNTNQTSQFTHKGKTYPAYRLTAEETLKLLKTFGYSVLMGDEFVPVVSIKSKKEFIEAQYKTSSGNGLMIHVKPNSTH